MCHSVTLGNSAAAAATAFVADFIVFLLNAVVNFIPSRLGFSLPYDTQRILNITPALRLTSLVV